MTTIKKGDYVFVYGTLRRGERADLAKESHHFNARFVGEDRVNGDIYNLGWYPGASVPEESSPFSPDHHSVVGDVFLVREDSLGVLLDAYEGYPNLYDRKEVQSEGGKRVWIYTYNGPLSPEHLIPSGDWKARSFKTIQSAAIVRAA